MKLRNKSRRAIANIKHEKPTNAYIVATVTENVTETNLKNEDASTDELEYDNDETQNTSALEPHEDIIDYIDDESSNINTSIEVKQEDTTKSENYLGENSGETRNTSQIIKSYGYECPICKEKISDFASMMEHRREIHKTKYRGRLIKHIDLEPDIEDLNHYCRACETAYGTVQRYRCHLRVVHYVYFNSRLNGPQMHILPNPDDPNFYCASCEHTYSKKAVFRTHLRYTHKMKLIRPCFKKKTTILPVWDNPDLYCPSCNFTYSSTHTYRAHCRITHNVRKPQADPKPKPNPNPNPKPKPKPKSKSISSNKISKYNFHCELCDKSFCDRYNYHRHQFTAHKKQPPALQRLARDIEPVIDDPNNYCRACDKTLSTEHSYSMHLLGVHSMRNERSQKRSVEPDADDPNFYCSVCNRHYRNRANYRQHLRTTHKMILERLGSNKDKSKLWPNPFDTNFYCRVCKVQYKSLDVYRLHCTSVHHLKSGPSIRRVSKRYPNAMIDINNPDFYCAQCDKYHTKKAHFTRHLQTMHFIDPELTKFPYPNAAVDINSPDLYCAKCDKHLSRRRHFLYHMTQVHDLPYPFKK